MIACVATRQRLLDKGASQGERRRREFGAEVKHRRIELGLAQREVADAAHVDRGSYSRIERGTWRALTFVTAARIAAVLGLDLSVKIDPAGPSIRDAGQTRRMATVLRSIQTPLRYRVEAPLPAREGGFEQRACDCVIYGYGERTGVEFETVLHDVQAQRRRHALKLRGDAVDHFLLVIANTRANRRVLDASAEHFRELPRLRTATVLATLRAGRHPPTGHILLPTPRSSKQAAAASTIRGCA